MLRTLRDWVDYQAVERPDAIYLIAPGSARELTFAGLQQASRRLAHHLVGLGVEPGEKVAMLMGNGYQAARLFVGIMYGGYC
ncbi:MAG: AMP-binding protein, partial [Casimicrobiaceae bacterium]